MLYEYKLYERNELFEQYGTYNLNDRFATATLILVQNSLFIVFKNLIHYHSFYFISSNEF